ncbi:MAG: CARDB domain-containing protein [Candidatus Sedimenticola sp. PURPLELP]
MKRLQGIWKALSVSLILSVGAVSTSSAVDYGRTAPVQKMAPKFSTQTKKLVPLVVPASRPDLKPNSITFSPGKPVPGDTVTVSVTVWNVGQKSSPATVVSLKMTATYPPQGQTSPVFTAAAPLASVEPNRAKVAQFVITMNNATRGQWKAETVVDMPNTVPEANEANNTMHQLFQVL